MPRAMRHTFAPSPLIDMAGQDEGAGPAPVEQFFETVELEDGKLHLQVMRLRKQLFVWLGFSGAEFSNMVAAVDSRLSTTPSLTSLMGSDAGGGLAQRIARRIGRPIILSYNLPSSSPMIEPLAERQLVMMLNRLGEGKKVPAA